MNIIDTTQNKRNLLDVSDDLNADDPTDVTDVSPDDIPLTVL